MTIYTKSGGTKTQATRGGIASVATLTESVYTLNADLYEDFGRDTIAGTRDTNGTTDERLLLPAGSPITLSAYQQLFPVATFGSVVLRNSGTVVTTALAAGGTVATITGTNLRGVTAVAVGTSAPGTAATSVVVVNPTTVTCTLPAQTAGARNLYITDDSGLITAANAITYA